MRPTPPNDAELRLQQEIVLLRAELEVANEKLHRERVALDAARARFDDLYRGAPVALLTLGVQGRIHALNQRAETLLQIQPGTRPRFADFLRPEAIPSFERERARLLSGGPAIDLELELRRPSGPVWAQVTMNLAREETSGSLVCQLALVDVTELKHMHEDVARLAAIVDSAEQAIMSEDLDGIITSWNGGAERLFGYTSSEALTRPVGILIPPDALAEERETHARIRARMSHVRETRRLRRNGTLVHVLIASAPILDAGGRLVGVSHIVHDITRQVEARHEIQRLLRDLREADRRKDTFIAMLAHELRNPLAPIRNATAVLRFAPDLDPKLQWCRDVIDRQVTHMSALLEDLLDVSRLTRDRILLRWDRVELGTVILQAVETARPLIEGRRHNLTLDLPPEPMEIEGDLNRLVQIFGNLLSNAAKYTDPDGEINIRAVRHGDEVIVSVRDNGIGIHPDALGTIFELFSQIDPEAEASAGGLGIGLALVKGLVERHRGTVVAHSDGTGKGSTFVVALPLATSAPSSMQPRAGDTRRDGRHTEGSRRILVVDDNIDAAESMAIVLRLEGYEVRTAHDGEQALGMARDFAPEVVLLDLGMPRLNGYDVARRLRAEDWARDVFLVACTGWGQPEDRRRSKGAGFDHHLVKPVSPDAVLDLVGALPASKRS